MSLNRVLQKRQITVIGLNSGTSADGLDMAAVRFLSIGDRLDRKEFLEGKTKKYSPALREQILKTMHSPEVRIDDLMYLDNLIGHFFGKETAKFLHDLSGQGLEVDVIASHGQTVRHLPVKSTFLGYRVRGTLQLGSPEFISAATGKLVVSDFRQADIAVGNEGAPITTFAVQELFSDRREPRLVLNIGGIANYFYLPPRNEPGTVESADCGPGNSLSDSLSAKLFDEKFDRNGRRASHGKPSERLLTLLSSDKFYSGQVRSTGKEVFGETMAEKMIAFGKENRLSGADLLATAAELAVRSIVWKLTPIIERDSRLTKIYLTGGGRNNIFFVRRLQQSLPAVHICRIDELGISGDYVEAASYAVLGEACLRGCPMNVAGKNSLRPVLGRITQPPVDSPKKVTGKSA